MAHTDSSQGGEALPSSNKSSEQATLIATLVHLWPYIWPTDRADLKMRVVWSMVLLLLASPLLMTWSYGVLRVLMAVLTQWRDGIFARVAMHAVRKLAYRTFIHMHELSLRFHLERKTGGRARGAGGGRRRR